MKRIHAFDLGGSGAKEAVFEADLRTRQLRIIGAPRRADDGFAWQDFETWAARRVSPEVDIVAVSCAGIVNAPAGVVRLSRVANWRNRPIVANLRKVTGGKPSVVVNDAEAHLIACMLPSFRHPIIALSVGTSLGFAVSTDGGTIYRPRTDTSLDLGSIRIPTSATSKEVWWAVGSHGLQELQRLRGPVEGAKQFGYRLGAFLRDMTIAFQPRSVVLSGGIVARHWQTLEGPIRRECESALPDFVEPPQLACADDPANAALWGAARLAAFGAG